MGADVPARESATRHRRCGGGVSGQCVKDVTGLKRVEAYGGGMDRFLERINGVVRGCSEEGDMSR